MASASVDRFSRIVISASARSIILCRCSKSARIGTHSATLGFGHSRRGYSQFLQEERRTVMTAANEQVATFIERAKAVLAGNSISPGVEQLEAVAVHLAELSTCPTLIQDGKERGSGNASRLV